MSRSYIRKILTIPLMVMLMMSMLYIPVQAAGNSHKIYYYLEYEELTSPQLPAITVNDNGSFTIPNVVPSGYCNFKGWFLKRLSDNKYFSKSSTWISGDEIYTEEASLTLFQPGRTLTLLPSWYSGTSASTNFALCALCDSQQYTISYDANGGTSRPDSQTVGYLDYFNIPTQAPVRSGYNFKGWGLKRLSDNKFYVAGVGWKTFHEISETGSYNIMLYSPGMKDLQLDYDWVKGETTPKGFVYVAQWEPAGQRVIADGRYHIVSQVDDDLCVSVNGASTAEDANIVVWRSRNLVEQAWDVRYEGDGFYSFTNVNSGYRMDLDGAKLEAGTNVKQHHNNGEDAQKWCIVLNSDDSYCIQSKVSGMYLDVVNLGTANGTNVGVHSNNATAAQRFYFVKYAGQTLSNGRYQIKSSANNNMVVGVSNDSADSQANVCLRPASNDSSRLWDVTYLGGGYYKIINVKSGKSLDVSGMNRGNKVNVQQYNYNTAGANSQMWILVPGSSTSTYNVISKCGGRYLDISGGGTADGANIWMVTGSGGNSQNWIFTKVEDSGGGSSTGGNTPGSGDTPGGGTTGGDTPGGTPSGGSGSSAQPSQGSTPAAGAGTSTAKPREIVDLPKVKISKPKAAKKSATIKWKKVSKKNRKKISKIQIQYSRDRSFRTGVKTTTAKKTAVSKKIKKLKSKKTYYVRVRAYKKVGSVVHVSKWSTVKKVKIK